MSLTAAPPPDPGAAVAAGATRPGRRALRIRGRQVRAVVAPLAFFILFVVLWQNRVFHELFGLETFAVPLPERILDSFREDSSRLREAFGETFLPAFMGYAGGNLLGFLLALGLTALPPELGRRGSALGAAVAALPIMAVAPIVALWIASELWFKTVTVVIIVFPSMLVYAYRGMTSVDPTALELMSSYRASSWQVLRALRLPNAVPQIFTALKYTTVLMLVGRGHLRDPARPQRPGLRDPRGARLVRHPAGVGGRRAAGPDRHRRVRAAAPRGAVRLPVGAAAGGAVMARLVPIQEV